jgi:hypothetical protein
VRTNFLRKVETRIAFLRSYDLWQNFEETQALTTCQVYFWPKHFSFLATKVTNVKSVIKELLTSKE